MFGEHVSCDMACPHCGESEIDALMHDPDDLAEEKIDCLTCGRSYRLVVSPGRAERIPL